MRTVETNYTGLFKRRHLVSVNPFPVSEYDRHLQTLVTQLVHFLANGKLPNTPAEKRLGRAVCEYLNSYESRRARNEREG